MKNKKITLVIMAILLFGSILSGCGKGSFSIEGTWDVIDDEGMAGTVDFKNNSTFIMSSGVFQIGGNYTLEDKVLTLKYAKEEPRSYEIEIEDDKSIKFYSIDKDSNRTDEETLTLTKQD